MSEGSRERIGKLIQDYARAKQNGGSGAEDETSSGDGMASELKDRVDMLGFEYARLLEVPPERALRQLEALEREAEREDAQAKRRANRVRAEEERTIHDTENRTRGNDRVRPGRHRGSGRGRRRR